MKTKPTLVSKFIEDVYPIIGVIFLGWNIGSIIFLFWFENLVIGLFNILKMIKSERKSYAEYSSEINDVKNKRIVIHKEILILLFFIIYGFFILIHGLLVLAIFIGNPTVSISIFTGIILIAVHYILDYKSNFISTGKFKELSAYDLLFSPFKNVLIIQIALFLGGTLALTINANSIGILVALCLVKFLFDFLLHNGDSELPDDLTPSQRARTITLNPKLGKLLLPFVVNIAAGSIKQAIKEDRADELFKDLSPKQRKNLSAYLEKEQGIFLD